MDSSMYDDAFERRRRRRLSINTENQLHQVFKQCSKHSGDEKISKAEMEEAIKLLVADVDGADENIQAAVQKFVDDLRQTAIEEIAFDEFIQMVIAFDESLRGQSQPTDDVGTDELPPSEPEEFDFRKALYDQQMEELEQQAQNYYYQSEQLKTELKEAKQQIKRSESQREKYTDMVEQLERTNTELADAQLQMETLGRQVKDLQNQLGQMKKDKEEASTTAQTEIDRLEAENAKLSAGQAQRQKTIKQLEEQLDHFKELEEILSTKELYIKDLQKKMDELRARSLEEKEILEAENQNFRGKLRRMMDRGSSRNLTLYDELKGLGGRKSDEKVAQPEVAQAVEESAKEQEEVEPEPSASDNWELESQLAESNAQIDQLNERLKQEQLKYRTLEEQDHQKDDEMQQLRERIIEHERLEKKLTLELQELKEEFQKTQEQRDGLAKEVKSKNEQTRLLESEKETLVRTKGELEESVKQLESALEQQKSRTSAVQQQLNESNTHASDLQRQLVDTQTHVTELESTIATMKTQVTEKENEIKWARSETRVARAEAKEQAKKAELAFENFQELHAHRLAGKIKPQGQTKLPEIKEEGDAKVEEKTPKMTAHTSGDMLLHLAQQNMELENFIVRGYHEDHLLLLESARELQTKLLAAEALRSKVIQRERILQLLSSEEVENVKRQVVDLEETIKILYSGYQEHCKVHQHQQNYLPMLSSVIMIICLISYWMLGQVNPYIRIYPT